MADTYIVECAVCQQPWEVPRPIANVVGQRQIVVPMHAIIDSKGEAGAIACSGGESAVHPGVLVGTRADWESRWPSRFVGRKRPALKDGSGIRAVTIG